MKIAKRYTNQGIRPKLIELALQNIQAWPSRKQVVQKWVDGTLTPGEKLTFNELDFLWDWWHEGRSDLFPERFPSCNGPIEEQKSREFWGELYPHIEEGLKQEGYER